MRLDNYPIFAPLFCTYVAYSCICFGDYVGGFGWFSGTFLDTSPFNSAAHLPDTQHLRQDACSPATAGISSNLLNISTLGNTHSVLKAHLLVVLKAFIVLSSWICGYFGLKHLPLTIVGPINATRPRLSVGAGPFRSYPYSSASAISHISPH